MTARIAASSISSGSGHDSWCALAARSTSETVDCAHPHEKAMLFWLTPIAANLRISLYLTISFPFSRWPTAPLWRQIDSKKGKSPETGLWISAKRGTPIGASWNSYQLCILYALARSRLASSSCPPEFQYFATVCLSRPYLFPISVKLGFVPSCLYMSSSPMMFRSNLPPPLPPMHTGWSVAPVSFT